MFSDIYTDCVVHESVCDDNLMEAKKHLKNYIKKLCEREEYAECALENQPTKLCDINDLKWLNEHFDKKLVKCNSEMKKDENGSVITGSELWLELHEALVSQMKIQHKAIEQATADLNANKAKLMGLKEFLFYTEEHIETQIDAESSFTSILDLPAVERKAKESFREYRSDLNKILDTCHSHIPMREILEKLVNAAGKDGEDRYIEVVNEEYYPCITLLLKAYLIVRHPNNIKLYRLDDFVD